ncbi:type IV conjugative transfer system protein TraE, partial [Burkholderia glumae]|uniref:type IV conjugative transfer system protein TraE n=1 Tax=Burkholderia glumae TaxID=337 RepID=UPI00203668EF
KLLLVNGSSSLVIALVCAWLMVTQRVVIMPPAVRGTYVIGARYANDEYLADQAAYVLSLAKSVTPNTVDSNERTRGEVKSRDDRGTLMVECASLLARTHRHTQQARDAGSAPSRQEHLVASGRTARAGFLHAAGRLFAGHKA